MDGAFRRTVGAVVLAIVAGAALIAFLVLRGDDRRAVSLATLPRCTAADRVAAGQLRSCVDTGRARVVALTRGTLKTGQRTRPAWTVQLALLDAQGGEPAGRAPVTA